MTEDDVAKLAQEAGDDWDHSLREDQEFLIRFASLVEAKVKADLRSAPAQPQQEPLADALRLLRTAIQTGHPEYGPADWIDMIDTALEGQQQEPDLYTVFRYARETDTPLLRHCLELIEGEWPADDPAAGPLMVKLRQRLGAAA